MNKPRVVKDYDKLSDDIVEQIKLNYPRGFQRNLITFKNAQGRYISALPFDTEDTYYLIRMTKAEAVEIIENDDDYDDDGLLKKDVREDYEEKYDDSDGEEFDFDSIVDEDINFDD
ncbi:MAG: hypothetical protein HC803_09755 [Saprospiraceae bacterium]|nr:hypothetical protein [Saprospiraceae bacterium]